MSDEIPSNISNRRLRVGPVAVLLLAALPVVAWALPASFYHNLFGNDGISITFLDRHGKEIGKRGVPSGSPAAEGADYFLDWSASEVRRLMKGRNEKVLTALTTFDGALQIAAGQAIEKQLAEQGEPFNVKQAALVSMELPDGAVRAMAGGRGYDGGWRNRAAVSLRNTGSSFKPYVYLTALETGLKPDSAEVDGPVSCGNWTPAKYGRNYRSSMTLTAALAQSINTIAVKLSLKAGREKVLANLKKMGLGDLIMTCSLALGDQGMTLLRHTAGFAHFASGGKSVRPYAIVELRNASGEVVYSRSRDEPPQEQIFDRRVVEDLNGMLHKVITEGTGKQAALDFTNAAGKTGTTSEYRDGWFIGFTGRYVTGVWFGNDNNGPTDKMTGGTLPALAWKQYNIAAHTDMDIPPVPGVAPRMRQSEQVPGQGK